MSDKIQTAGEKAVSAFASGFNCSQAVLWAFSESSGMDQATAFKVACAFGGGISSTGNLYGAVTGGLMAIGLKHGRTTIEDLPAKDKTYALSRQFMAEFAKKNGSIVCKELLKGCDLSTPEGSAEFSRKGLKAGCTGYVKDSVEILEKLL